MALHVANGAMFGAVYALARPLVPGPPIVAGVAAGMAEHFGFWPLGVLIDRHHPARDELEPLRGNRRAFAQATWRHFLFGVVLAELERRLNDKGEFEPLEGVPVVVERPREPGAGGRRGHRSRGVGQTQSPPSDSNRQPLHYK